MLLLRLPSGIYLREGRSRIMIISFAGTRLRRGEVADPEQSAYISECLSPGLLLYNRENSAENHQRIIRRPAQNALFIRRGLKASCAAYRFG